MMQALPHGTEAVVDPQEGCLEAIMFHIAESHSSLRKKPRKNISKLRSIMLLNMQRKMFFSGCGYLMENNYIDTSFQKAGVSGLPWYVKHYTTKHGSKLRINNDLHIVWLDLSLWVSVPAH